MEYTFGYENTEDIVGHIMATENIVPANEISTENALKYAKENPHDIFMKIYAIKRLIKEGKENLKIPELSYFKPDPEKNEMLSRGYELEGRIVSGEKLHKEFLDVMGKLAGEELEKKYHPIAGRSYSGIERDCNLGTSLREFSLGSTLKKLSNREILEKIGFVKFYSMPSMGSYAASAIRKVDISSPFAPFSLKGLVAQGGKGISEEHAVASAVMETVERFCSEMSRNSGWPKCYREEMDLTKSAYLEMESCFESVLDPKECSFNIMYENEEIYWVRGKTPSGKEKYVPADTVFCKAVFDAPMIFNQGTTGLASGNTENDAKLQSLLEIIERDSTFTSVEEKGYVPKPFDVLTGNIINSYEKEGMQLFVNDISSDFGIPVMEAFTILGDKKISGYGADLNGKRALTRALCELNTAVRGCIDLGFSSKTPSASELPEMNPENLPNYSSGNVSRDLETLEKLFDKNGFEVIYVNLTHKDIGIPVVKSIIPGLGRSELNARYFSHLHKAVKEKHGL